MPATIEIYLIFLCLWSYGFVCESKAIIIAHIDDNDKLRLNLPALKKLLDRPEIQDKKLMIVSIVGEMRTGKSFISGYKIRYGQNKGWRNKSWIGDAQSKTDGFSWGPGTRRNTTGIDLWDERFIIEDINGEEVVVMLLDTQGLFDDDTTMTNNARITAICMLASSLLIMNFKDKITEMDLQNWQQSADFAKVASSVDKRVFELPACLVLVQNWVNPQEYEFGIVGGKKYKNYVLDDVKKKPELNLVRRNIASSFPSIEFFLMPDPGEKVRSPTFRGTNKEVKDEYLQYVKIYVEHIFNVENLAIKQLQEKSMTPKTYYDFLVSVDKALSSDQMPTVDDLGEAFARVVYSDLHAQCLKKFTAEMKGHINVYNKGIIGSQEFEDLYISHKDLYMDDYKSSKIIGSGGQRYEFAQKLSNDMEAQFQTMEREMDIKRKQHLSDTVRDLFKICKDALDKISEKNPTNIGLFRQSYLAIIDEKMKLFDKRSLNCDPYVKDFKQKLKDQIDEYYKGAKEAMLRLQVEEIKREKIQRKKEAAEERERQEIAQRRRAEEEAKQAVAKQEEAEEQRQKAVAEKEEADRKKNAALAREQKALQEVHNVKSKIQRCIFVGPFGFCW